MLVLCFEVHSPKRCTVEQQCKDKCQAEGGRQITGMKGFTFSAKEDPGALNPTFSAQSLL